LRARGPAFGSGCDRAAHRIVKMRLAVSRLIW